MIDGSTPAPEPGQLIEKHIRDVARHYYNGLSWEMKRTWNLALSEEAQLPEEGRIVDGVGRLRFTEDELKRIWDGPGRSFIDVGDKDNRTRNLILAPWFLAAHIRNTHNMIEAAWMLVNAYSRDPNQESADAVKNLIDVEVTNDAKTGNAVVTVKGAILDKLKQIHIAETNKPAIATDIKFDITTDNGLLHQLAQEFKDDGQPISSLLVDAMKHTQLAATFATEMRSLREAVTLMVRQYEHLQPDKAIQTQTLTGIVQGTTPGNPVRCRDGMAPTFKDSKDQDVPLPKATTMYNGQRILLPGYKFTGCVPATRISFNAASTWNADTTTPSSSEGCGCSAGSPSLDSSSGQLPFGAMALGFAAPGDMEDALKQSLKARRAAVKPMDDDESDGESKHKEPLHLPSIQLRVAQMEKFFHPPSAEEQRNDDALKQALHARRAAVEPMDDSDDDDAKHNNPPPPPPQPVAVQNDAHQKLIQRLRDALHDSSRQHPGRHPGSAVVKSQYRRGRRGPVGSFQKHLETAGFFEAPEYKVGDIPSEVKEEMQRYRQRVVGRMVGNTRPEMDPNPFGDGDDQSVTETASAFGGDDSDAGQHDSFWDTPPSEAEAEYSESGYEHSPSESDTDDSTSYFDHERIHKSGATVEDSLPDFRVEAPPSPPPSPPPLPQPDDSDSDSDEYEPFPEYEEYVKQQQQQQPTAPPPPKPVNNSSSSDWLIPRVTPSLASHSIQGVVQKRLADAKRQLGYTPVPSIQAARKHLQSKIWNPMASKLYTRATEAAARTQRKKPTRKNKKNTLKHSAPSTRKRDVAELVNKLENLLDQLKWQQ